MWRRPTVLSDASFSICTSTTWRDKRSVTDSLRCRMSLSSLECSTNSSTASTSVSRPIDHQHRLHHRRRLRSLPTLRLQHLSRYRLGNATTSSARRLSFLRLQWPKRRRPSTYVCRRIPTPAAAHRSKRQTRGRPQMGNRVRVITRGRRSREPTVVTGVLRYAALFELLP